MSQCHNFGRVLIVSIILLSSGCGSKPQFEVYAKDLRAALDVLLVQRDITVKKYEEAEIARTEALAQNEFKFTSSKTRSFIGKWATTEAEVKTLREKYNDLLKSVDVLFTYCFEKCNTINDSGMRSSMHDMIERHRKRFTNKAINVHQEIARVEKAISMGKDLIKALEIVGALGAVQEKTNDMDSLAKSASQLRPSIDELRNEGEALLKLELSAIVNQNK